MFDTQSISSQLHNLRRVVLLRGIEVGVQVAVIATAVHDTCFRIGNNFALTLAAHFIEQQAAIQRCFSNIHTEIEHNICRGQVISDPAIGSFAAISLS